MCLENFPDQIIPLWSHKGPDKEICGPQNCEARCHHWHSKIIINNPATGRRAGAPPFSCARGAARCTGESPVGSSRATTETAADKARRACRKDMAGSKGGQDKQKTTTIRKSCDFCNQRKKRCDGDGVNSCRYVMVESITDHMHRCPQPSGSGTPAPSPGSRPCSLMYAVNFAVSVVRMIVAVQEYSMERARRLLAPGSFVEQITLCASAHAHARFHHALLALSHPCFPARNVHDGTCLLAYALKRSRQSASTADGGRKGPGRGRRGWMQRRRAPDLSRRLPRQTSRVGRPLPYCKRKGGPSKGASWPHVAMYVLAM